MEDPKCFVTHDMKGTTPESKYFIFHFKFTVHKISLRWFGFRLHSVSSSLTEKADKVNAMLTFQLFQKVCITIFPSHITFILFVLLGKYSWVDVGRVVLTDPDHCCHFFQIPAPTS